MSYSFKKIGFKISVVFIASAISSTGAQEAVRNCSELKQEVSSVQNSYQDLIDLLPLLQASECKSNYLKKVRLKTSFLIAKKTGALMEAEDFQSASDLLDLAPETTWYTSELRGDIHASNKKWKQAMEQYNLAYDRAKDNNPRKSKLFKKASEALLLHGSLSKVVERSSEGSGILGHRGPKPEYFPVPIQFEYDKSELSEQGVENAEALLSYLQNKAGLSQITLVGHTDTDGKAEYNLKLSQQRAQALKKLLIAKGLNTPIVTTGKGESMPPDLSDPGQYTRDEFNSLARRVEFKVE